MDYLISKVMLMVAGIALSKGRHFFYCLLFFYIWALYKLAAPLPSSFSANPAEWYWICLSAECVLIALALIVKPNARSLIIAASTVQILANSVSIYSRALYDLYPIIIRSCEISQCLILIIWSPLVLKQIERLRTRLQGIAIWMLRLVKT